MGQINIKYILIGVILAMIIAGQTYFLIDFYSKNKALEKSFGIFEQQAEKDKADLKKQNDSIAQIAHWLLQDIASLNNSLEKIEIRINKINSRSNENKTTIRNIRDVDSLTKLLTDRYKGQ